MAISAIKTRIEFRVSSSHLCNRKYTYAIVDQGERISLATIIKTLLKVHTAMYLYIGCHVNLPYGANIPLVLINLQLIVESAT